MPEGDLPILEALQESPVETAQTNYAAAIPSGPFVNTTLGTGIKNAWHPASKYIGLAGAMLLLSSCMMVLVDNSPASEERWPK